MPNRGPDDELLAASLKGGADCPSVENLERLLDARAPQPLKEHVDNCAHCRTELQLLRSFVSNEVAPHEQAAVAAVVASLQARSAEVVGRRIAAEERVSWWGRVLDVGWLAPTAAAMAAVLIVAGIAIQLRQGKQPSLDVPGGGAEVLRSAAIAITSPAGDVREKPSEIRWESVPNATRYKVQIMEVDRTELWSQETQMPRITLPAQAAALIVPTKTLLIHVEAFDAAGGKITESEPVRFRLLQNVYTR